MGIPMVLLCKLLIKIKRIGYREIMNQNLFSKNKKYKKIGIAVIAILTIIIFLRNVRFQSVSDYKAQQQSMVNEYNRNSDKQSVDVTTNSKIAGEDIGEDIGEVINGSISSETDIDTVDRSENKSIYNKDGQITDQNNMANNSTISGISSNNGSESGNIAGDNNGGTISVNDSKDNNSSADSETQYVTCTIEIRCDTLLNNMSNWTNKNKNPSKIEQSDGIILEKMTISVKDGSSVYDVLMILQKINKISVESDPNYIISFNQLAEMDVGTSSGWMYWVNDVQPPYGCSSYPVIDGDNIKWQYTCNEGKEFEENGDLK